MGTAYVKKLVHGDGEDFVLWHPKANVYCPVLCDEDCPPDPMWLGLNLGEESTTEVAHLRWEITGESYDDETGEARSRPASY